MGFVDFRVLGDIIDPRRDLFDAGRVIPDGQAEVARMKAPRGGGRLVVRTAAGHRLDVEVKVDGRTVGMLPIWPAVGWIEPAIDLPAGLPDHFELSLTPRGGDWLDCHVWVLEGGGAP
jgi:hypothetical protein